MAETIPCREYERRLMATQQEMEQLNIDALVLSDPANYIYFTNHEMPFAPWNGNIKARPYIVIIPKEGDPVLLVQASYERAGREYSWIKKIKTWSSLPFKTDYLLEGLSLLDLDLKKIAGPGERLGFPFQEYMRLKELLPRTQLIDAGLVTQRIRRYKSVVEIEMLKKIHTLTEKAFTDLLDGPLYEVSPDLLTRKARRNLYLGGCHEVSFCRTLPPSYNQKATSTPVFIWGGGMLYGYRSNVTVFKSNGSPFPPASVTELLSLLVAESQPGEYLGRIAEHCHTLIEKHKTNTRIPKMGVIGHGIGLDACEQPWLEPENKAILEPGNVISLGFEFKTASGWFPIYKSLYVSAEGVISL